MRLLKRRPGAAIGAFVEYLWLLVDAPLHARERIVPTGTMELVINLHEDEIRVFGDAAPCRRYSGAVVSGAYDHPFEIDTAAHARIMGVHFRPGGALPFTRVPPGELANGHFDAATFWGPEAARLRERLCSAPTHQDRFDILDRALAVRAAGDRSRARSPIARALPRLMQSREAVADIVSSLGISHRHFAALFRREVGMAPKLFARIQRFQSAMAATRQGKNADLARLAVECGYFDQAHMNRDFAAFAQLTPREYLRQQSERTKEHHVALR